MSYNACMDETKLFQVIPGVGKSLSRDLVDLGFRSLGELASADPEQMYQRLATLRGERIDPCVMYVFRCAVYFCSHDEARSRTAQMVELEGQANRGA